MSTLLNEGKLITYAIDEMVEVFDQMTPLASKTQAYDPGETMQRSNNAYWKPLQQNGITERGWDMTGKFNGVLELSVQGALGEPLNTNRQLRIDDVRDETSWRRAIRADAMQVMAQIELDGLKKAATHGAFCTTHGAAYGSSLGAWDALANAEGKMFATGYNTKSGITAYINQAAYLQGGKDLINSAASYSQKIPDEAYSKGLIQRQVAGVSEVQRHNLLPFVSAQTASVTINGAQKFAPLASEQSANGSAVPFDNRYATINVTGTLTNVAVGDKFTIPGMYALNLATKEQQAHLMTFTVVGKDTGKLTISPRPIALDDTSLSTVQKAYANVSTSLDDLDVVTWLNAKAVQSSIIMVNDAMTLASSRLPTSHELYKNLSTRSFKVGPINGLIATEGDINTMNGKLRTLFWYDWQVEKPEQVGVILAGQS